MITLAMKNTTDWNRRDSQRAASEGWGLASSGGHPEVQRLDGKTPFASDVAAFRFVRASTTPHARKAVRLIASSPKGYYPMEEGRPDEAYEAFEVRASESGKGFTVYGHRGCDGPEAITDRPTFEAARELVRKLGADTPQ